MKGRSRPVLSLLVGLLLAATWTASAVADSTEGTGQGTCVVGPNTLCLLDDRFAVEVGWADGTGNSGAGLALPLYVGNAGFFTYDDPRYLEVQVEVLDGCAFNGHYWVFTAGLSDYQQTLGVLDTVSGGIATFDNDLGEFGLTFADTAVFPCATEGGTSVETDDTSQKGPGDPPPPMSLMGGRFQLELRWVDAANNFGFGNPLQVTEDSGTFRFFTDDSPNLAVKIFDGSALNGFFWVVLGGPVSVSFDLEIVDRCTGVTSVYHNPQGNLAVTQVDTDAFVATPACVLLLDGFETGDTSGWSAAIP